MKVIIGDLVGIAGSSHVVRMCDILFQSTLEFQIERPQISRMNAEEECDEVVAANASKSIKALGLSSFYSVAAIINLESGCPGWHLFRS